MALQFAKLSGLVALTTCSPHNFTLVKQYGADKVFDYKDLSCGAQIRESTQDNLQHVFDCIAKGSSPQICADALSSKGGGIYSALLRVEEFPRYDINNTCTLAHTARREPWRFRGHDMPAKPQDYEFAVKFWTLAQTLLESGSLKAQPLKVGEGLEGVLDGLDLLMNGKVSGQKLVYRIEHNP